MLHIHERAETTAEPAERSLTLPFEQRTRSRLRTQLDSGEEVALELPRGSTLRGGDLLRTTCGQLVRVRAAPEPVSTVRSAEATLLIRAAYHLGNRHVALQVGQDFVRYLHDHVLDAMVQNLGLTLDVEDAPFEPEAGAYGHGADHGHRHPERGHQRGNHEH